MHVLVVVGALAMVCSGAALAGIYGLANRYEGKVNRVDILADVPLPEKGNRWQTGPLNFLVLGSDARDTQGTSLEDADGSRSDTIMIVHVSKDLDSAFIFSIPRDSYVHVPAGGGWRGGKNKINAAFAYGGAKLAAKTVYQLTRIPLDGAMIVNFGGLGRLVDLVGGINVCLPYDVYYATGKAWNEGCHDMNADQAETLVRAREGVPGGDFGRIHDQQLVVRALLTRISAQGMVTNPIKLDKLLVAVAESVTVDQRTNLRELVMALKGVEPAHISFATTPYTGTMTTDAGSSVGLDMPAARAMFRAVLDDTTPAWLAAHPQTVPTGF